VRCLLIASPTKTSCGARHDHAGTGWRFGHRYRRRVRVASRAHSRRRRATWAEPSSRSRRAHRGPRPERIGEVDARGRLDCTGEGECRSCSIVRPRHGPARSRCCGQTSHGARRRGQPAVRPRPDRRPRLPRQRGLAVTSLPYRPQRRQARRRGHLGSSTVARRRFPVANASASPWLLPSLTAPGW
jgi:hypothetical protein